MRARGLFLLVGAIPFGCSLFIGTDELIEGEPSSSGGSDASVGSDVSVEAGSGGTGGTKDAGNDAPPASDSSDAAAEADAPVLGFCESLSPQPTVCSDFDLQNFPAGWDTHSEWGKCNGIIDLSDSTSGPRSFHCSTPLLVDGADQCATALIKVFDKPEESLRIEFDVRFDQIDGPNLLHLVMIDTSNSAGSDTLNLRIRTGEGLISETARPKEAGFLYSGHQFPKPPVVGQWSHVLWTIDFTGAKAQSNITVNGDTSFEELYMKAYLGDLHIKLGIGFVDGASGPWEIHIDNLVVDVK